MAWVISNWEGFSQWKEPSGVSHGCPHTHTHTHGMTQTHTYYTVTNKDMALNTLPVNCLEIFIAETLTWEIGSLYHSYSPDWSLISSALKATLWPCRWAFVHRMCQVPDTILEFVYVRFFFSVSRARDTQIWRKVCEFSWLCGRKDDCHSSSPSVQRWQVMEVKMTLVSVVMRCCGG